MGKLIYICTTNIKSSLKKKKKISEGENMTTLTPSSTVRVPVNLADVGYDGTWERFCDPEEIKKDFPLYPNDHDVKSLRTIICILKVQNKIVKESLLAFTVYKYCVTVSQ